MVSRSQYQKVLTNGHIGVVCRPGEAEHRRDEFVGVGQPGAYALDAERHETLE